MNVIRKGSCGLFAVAIFMAGAHSAFARDLAGNIRTCGKWVVRLEDDKKRRVKAFPPYEATPVDTTNPPETEVAVSFLFRDSLPVLAFLESNEVIVALQRPRPNQLPTVGIQNAFTLAQFRQKGKKVKIRTVDPVGGDPAFVQGSAALALQFTEMAAIATGGSAVVSNAILDFSRKYKFKGRYKGGRLKAKLKATMLYDVSYPGDPSRNRTSQRGRLKWRGKSKNCSTEQF